MCAGAIVVVANEEEGAEYPQKLPANPVPPQKMRQRYRLSAQAQEVEPLRTEIQTFKDWMASPVQMDRQGALLATRTIKNLTTNVLEFLGFCKLHLSVSVPELLLYMDMKKLGQFISYHIAKGNTITTIAHHLGTARKVYSYLTRRADTRLGSQLQRADDYTSRLTKQLSRIMTRPKPDVADLIEQGSWMEASELVKLITAFKLETEKLLPAEDQPLSMYMARQLHDACLACCMFGHLGVPRCCVLRTLQHPDTSKCLHPDCLRQDCMANKLYWKDGQLHLSMSHFKVNRV